MNIKIGAIIKKLRTEHKITQETLANALDVTPQAISRWEANGGYPDLDVLPALADFFCVSIDELCGYKTSEIETRLAKNKKELERLSEIGTIAVRIDYARNALIEFPFDFDLKLHLEVALYHQWQNNENEHAIQPKLNHCVCQLFRIIKM